MDYKNEFQSDDDFDCSNGYSDSYNNNAHGQSRHSNPNGLSKAELRKTNKPIMEKRRRARINHCLNELKSLILEAMKKDPARHTKLEKADILEMTVKHLQSVQRQQLNMAIQTDPTVIHKFKTGFTECAEEVNRYIGQLEGVDTVVRQRLTNHLNNCATSLEQIGSMTNFNNGYRGQLGAGGGLFGAALTASALAMPVAPAAGSGLHTNGALFPPLPQDLNNNSNGSSAGNPVAPIQMGGVQLIPSRLPSGEFALIVPNTPATAASSLLNHNNNSNNTNGSSPFASWPHALNAAAVATPAAATATATPLTAAGTPINDFAANFKRLSAFTKPPTQTAAKQTSIASNSNNNNHNASYIITPASHNYHHTQPHPHQQQQRSTAGHHCTAASTSATNSPPLSPISSISSHGDDSLMHTSSDFTSSRPATPPHDATSQQHSFSGVFSTPPSAESSLSTSTASSASASGSASSTANGPLSAHLQQQQVSSTSGNGSTNTNNNNNTNKHNSSPSSTYNDSTASLKRPLEDDEADSSDASAAAPAAKKAAVSELPSAPTELLTETLQMATQLKECCAADERDSMWRPW